jgi:hypothetical protein
MDGGGLREGGSQQVSRHVFRDKLTCSGPQMWYCTSKKYAEIAAFETQKRVRASYSLASLNPPGMYLHQVIVCWILVTADTKAIFGPPIHMASADTLSNGDVSTSTFFACLATGKDQEVPPTTFAAFADVSTLSSRSYLEELSSLPNPYVR